MMRRDMGAYEEEHGVEAGVFDGVTVARLPYQDDEVSMVLLIPDSHDGLPALEASLDVSKWEGFLGALHPHDGPLVLPRLELRTAANLVPHFEGMGVYDAFDESNADFTGIAQHDGLFISGIFHQAFVKVDEKGTEAAAATGVVVGIDLEPFRVIAEHPFLMVIQDDLTGAILFVGRVVDPS
jgi:serpin B